jgi:glycosyltransferase domain-containing protein
MPPSPKISLLFHTRNRPHFLLRALDHLQACAPLSEVGVVILDASSEDQFRFLQDQLERRAYGFNLDVMHTEPTTPLHVRFRDALEVVQSPYLVLAADDDLYMFDWLAEGVELLESEASIGTVYGHVLWFELDAFVPYGRLGRFFIHPRRNPPVHWLENPDPIERLLEIGDGRNGHAIIGWYALQRTEQLREFVRLASEIDLRADLVEYLLVFCQVVMGKTRMLDRIILARQLDPRQRHALPRPAASALSLERLKDACTAFLAEREGAPDKEARRVVERFFAGPVFQMRRAHRRRHLRRLADKLPFLRTAWGRLVGRAESPADEKAGVYPDPRLPPIPLIDRSHPVIDRIEDVVKRTGDGRPLSDAE